MNPAPPYSGEGPHALWHVSEDPMLRRFEPHLRPGHDADEPLVHLYAEGETAEDSLDLETELRTLVTEVIEREEVGSRT